MLVLTMYRGGWYWELLYIYVAVGAKEVKTRIINNTVQPVWNETFEMIVDSADGQLLYLDVFDDDPGSKDDELGR